MTTSTQPETQEQTELVYNAFGFCTECGLEQADAERWDDRQFRKVISVMVRHIRCNHVLIYRTIRQEWR